jgi:hypothetical protein
MTKKLLAILMLSSLTTVAYALDCPKVGIFPMPRDGGTVKDPVATCTVEVDSGGVSNVVCVAANASADSSYQDSGLPLPSCDFNTGKWMDLTVFGIRPLDSSDAPAE